MERERALVAAVRAVLGEQRLLVDDANEMADLVDHAKLTLQDIECVIINNAIGSLNTVLAEGDRVELVPVFGLE